ncbi:MAG: MFS transporter [Chroococcidiopsidaceae cyanobacterium CP_BM_ER_R8_30]|nr:MFS transporter [Chroococcidiopsidaceae cyanobacterium CP_BM_ER_R8_30]
MNLDLSLARIGPFWRVALLVGLTAAISALSSAFTNEKTTFLFKEELHLSVSDVGTLNIFLGIPLYLQPFLGAWSDLFPFLGYHRRSYFVLASGAGALGFLGLSLLTQYHYTTVACLLLVAIAGGTLMGVMVNAVMVAVGNLTGTFGILQSLAIIIPLAMSLTYTSHLGGYVTQHWSYQHCFQVAALLFLVYAPLALLIDEPRVTGAKPTSEIAGSTQTGQSERSRTAAALRQAATDRSMWAVIGFVFYLIVTPGIYTAQIYFMTDVLHFSKQFIGDLGRFDAAGQIVALAGFMAVSRFLPIRVLVWGAWLMDCLSYPAQMLLHDATSAKFVKFFSSFIGLLYSLCLNVLAAKACPPGIEGTIYGLVMAVIQLGGVLSEKFGGVLYDYFGPLNQAHHYTTQHGWLWALSIGLGFTLLAVIFIPFLPAWAKSHEGMNSTAGSLGNRH